MGKIHWTKRAEVRRKISETMKTKGIRPPSRKGVKINWIKKNCEICGGEFEIVKNKSWVKFCSKKCRSLNKSKIYSGRGNPTWNSINKICPICNKEFWVPKCYENRRKTCSRVCYSKYRFKYGGRDWYRKFAFKNLPHECRICGWNAVPEVLEVNHKNRNRKDNSLSNLEILCPTCHRIETFKQIGFLKI